MILILILCLCTPDMSFVFVKMYILPSREGELEIQGMDHRIVARNQIHRFTYTTVGCPPLPVMWQHGRRLCSVEDFSQMSMTTELERMQIHQRKDQVKWSRVDATDAMIIYQQLGPGEFADGHWVWWMLLERPNSPLLIFVDTEGNITIKW